MGMHQLANWTCIHVLMRVWTCAMCLCHILSSVYGPACIGKLVLHLPFLCQIGHAPTCIAELDTHPCTFCQIGHAAICSWTCIDCQIRHVSMSLRQFGHASIARMDADLHSTASSHSVPSWEYSRTLRHVDTVSRPCALHTSALILKPLDMYCIN